MRSYIQSEHNFNQIHLLKSLSFAQKCYELMCSFLNLSSFLKTKEWVGLCDHPAI